MRILGGRYRLRRPVGSGGMAVVWLADDTLLQRPVAVKMPHPGLLEAGWANGRVRDEALAASRLNHPHIAAVYDYGEDTSTCGGVLPYLVLEFVGGPDLAHRLGGGALSWPEAVRICAAVAEATAAAHAHGVVHRDIKARNIILGAAGVKVVDFGVSAGVGQDVADTAGNIWGTPSCQPPEIVTDATAAPAGDVFALGLLLVHCLTGRQPRRNPIEPAGADLLEDDAMDVPAEVHDLVRRCLAVNPARRPDAAAVAAGLRVAARQAGRVRQSWSGRTSGAPLWARRAPVRVAALAATVLAVMAAVGGTRIIGSGRPAGVIDGAGGETASCVADYSVVLHTDGTFTARLTLTNTGLVGLGQPAVRFPLPAGQSVTSTRRVQWDRARREVTVTIADRLGPAAVATTTIHGRAGYEGDLVPERFEVNDRPCERTIGRATSSGTPTPLPTTPPAPGAPDPATRPRVASPPHPATSTRTPTTAPDPPTPSSASPSAIATTPAPTSPSPAGTPPSSTGMSPSPTGGHSGEPTPPAESPDSAPAPPSPSDNGGAPAESGEPSPRPTGRDSGA